MQLKMRCPLILLSLLFTATATVTKTTTITEESTITITHIYHSSTSLETSHSKILEISTGLESSPNTTTVISTSYPSSSAVPTTHAIPHQFQNTTAAHIPSTSKPVPITSMTPTPKTAEIPSASNAPISPPPSQEGSFQGTASSGESVSYIFTGAVALGAMALAGLC